MTTIQVSIEDVSIEAGDTVRIQAQVVHTLGEVDYDWYVDGVSLEGVITQGLDLNWEAYVELFPEDDIQGEQDVVARLVTVEVTDMVGTNTDSALLFIDYIKEKQYLCGNDHIDSNDTRQEECDDGNIISGDGCSAMCLCEGVCESLFIF